MTGGDPTPRPGQGSLIERRVRRIVNARSATLGLAATFVLLALAGGLVIRVTDPENFSSVGLGIWWALQTVTTVGYGDVVPTSFAGRVVGGIEMVLGVAFIAFVTAGVTSALIQRASAEANDTSPTDSERNLQAMHDLVLQTNQALAALHERLDRIESKLGD
jgi:voltage-gated potassium channel